MVPMIDTMLMVPATTTVFTVGPALLGVALAMVFGLVWVARETAEELRRTAARDWERRIVATPIVSHGRLAA
jgi:hypothetical protein